MTSGITADYLLAWLVRNARRNPSAMIVIQSDDGPHHYSARVWRDGTIALRPIPAPGK